MPGSHGGTTVTVKAATNGVVLRFRQSDGVVASGEPLLDG